MTRTIERTDDRERATEGPACPECDGSIVEAESRAERVCEDCGLVVSADEIDRGPEWRAFDAEERDAKSRVGAPTTELLHDRGLSTTVGWKNEDGYGQPITGERRETLRRLRTWDERFRTRNARERNLKQALGEIDRMASALGLPETVRESASVVYRRALEEDLLPGRSIEGMATAALYAAARQASVPRSLDEFEGVSRVDRTEVQRTYRYLARELGLAIEPADPEEYVERFASELDVSSEARMLARDLLRDAKAEGVHSGKSPVGMAAAALYVAPRLTNESVTQAEVSDATEVSEVTIRNRYQELLEVADSV
ncbi:transcription initiation factor IIB 2 [Halobacteriales archaeon QS_1_68_20]|nr:MAG: transcription initiation factor IIB 2 [Halobacteriales archaeon QS_1_68_20]